jgi:hypothetical protein
MTLVETLFITTDTLTAALQQLLSETDLTLDVDFAFDQNPVLLPKSCSTKSGFNRSLENQLKSVTTSHVLQKSCSTKVMFYQSHVLPKSWSTKVMVYQSHVLPKFRICLSPVCLKRPILPNAVLRKSAFFGGLSLSLQLIWRHMPYLILSFQCDPMFTTFSILYGHCPVLVVTKYDVVWIIHVFHKLAAKVQQTHLVIVFIARSDSLSNVAAPILKEKYHEQKSRVRISNFATAQVHSRKPAGNFPYPFLSGTFHNVLMVWYIFWPPYRTDHRL